MFVPASLQTAPTTYCGDGEGRRKGNPAVWWDITAAVADVKRPWQLRDCLVGMEAMSIQHVPNDGDGHANVPQMLYQRELEILQTLLILPQDTKWKAHYCKMEITLLIPPGWGRREILHTEEWSFSFPKTTLKDQGLKYNRKPSSLLLQVIEGLWILCLAAIQKGRWI